MGRRSSITSDPDFQWIAFVIGLLLLGSFIYNFNRGGIVNAIVSWFQDVYNIIYVTVFIAILVVVVAWHEKWHLLGEWVIDRITIKKR